MAIDKDLLLRALTESGEPMSVNDLTRKLHIHPGERTEVKRALRELYRDGKVLKDGRRFYVENAAPRREREERGPKAGPARHGTGSSRPPPLVGAASRMEPQRGSAVTGQLKRHPDGYGFLVPIGQSRGDVFLPPEEASKALDGDVVQVELVEGRGGRTVGRIRKIIEQRRQTAMGTFVARGKLSYVQPTDRALADAIFVAPTSFAEDGDLVKVAITSGPTPTRGPEGTIIEVVGKPGDPKAEALDVAYRHGFSDEFPPDVVAEARTIPEEVLPSEITRRRDLRGIRLVTIDGEDARDFDDAVYVERVKAGGNDASIDHAGRHNAYRLVVAIADVAHYVRAGQPLDNEALRRATSVYFPQMVLPMLPERLSNGICSLNPDVDRLCMVADLVLEPDGDSVKVTDVEVYEGVMKSAARCTYTEVAQALAGDEVPHREFLRRDFELMEELARRLMKMRELRGAIDFDLPEVRPVLDEKYYPTAMVKRERNIAHRIVEEFMLAANEAVARYFAHRGLPTVYRVHGEPDEEKLELFLSLARAHGFELDKTDAKKGELDGTALNRMLKKMQGTPEQRTLNFLLLRAMMQAIYTSENIGHFGLAAPFYLHFTSPIRRYPDLLVHRMLKEHWARGARAMTEGETEELEGRLEGMAQRSSERERAAMQGEREVDNYYAALFMKDKVGEEFDASISSVADFGIFVELTEQFVEGLIKAETIGEDPEYDEGTLSISFANGMRFKIGDKLRVRLASVNLQRRQLEFELIELQEGQAFRPTTEGQGDRDSLKRAIDRLKKRRGLGEEPARAGGRGRAREGEREGARTRSWKDERGGGRRGADDRGGGSSSRGGKRGGRSDALPARDKFGNPRKPQGEAGGKPASGGPKRGGAGRGHKPGPGGPKRRR